MQIREMRERAESIYAQARAKLNETEGADESRAKEIEVEFDKMVSDADALVKRAEKLEAVEARQAELNAADPRRPQGEDRSAKSGEVAAIDPKDVFKRFVQFGTEGLDVAERRALASLRDSSPELRAQTTATGATGGFTIPQGFQPEIERSMLAYGPMFDPAVTRVLNTDAGNALLWPTSDDTAVSGRLLTENTGVTTTDIAFGQKQLDAFTYSSDLVLVPFQLLQDSAFNLESEVINPAFGERIGRIANSHLTVGTGSGQPNGIVTASTVGKTTAAIAAVTADEVIDFYHSIDPAYRASPNFKIMFNDSTLQAIRKLKDAQNRYLIDGLPGVGGGSLSIAGITVPYVINQAVASMATGAKFAVAGDFSKYIVRRVKGFTLLRLVERYADFLQVGFVAFARVDGECINTAAIKHMKNA